MSGDRFKAISRSFEQDFEVDRNLPRWARRTHPIVKRHLGMFWRVLPLQPDMLTRWYLIMIGVLVATMIFPFLYTVVLPLCLIGLTVLPFALVMYARTLYELAGDASRSMVREIEGKTLDLLLAAPIPAREVLLSKVAAAMWRQSDPMTMLTQVVLFSQLPTLMVIYINAFPPNEAPYVMQILAAIVFAACIVRIPLEMFMISSIGLFIGATTRGRSTAAASTLAIVVIYFVCINIPRLMPLSPVADVIVNAVIPVVAPIGLSALFLTLTLRHIYD